MCGRFRFCVHAYEKIAFAETGTYVIFSLTTQGTLVACHDAPPCRWLDSLGNGGNGRLGRAKRARQGWPAPPRSTRRRSPTGLLVPLCSQRAWDHRVMNTRCSSVECTDEYALAVPDKIISHCPFAFRLPTQGDEQQGARSLHTRSAKTK